MTKQDLDGFIKTGIHIILSVGANETKAKENFNKLPSPDREGFRELRNALNKLFNQEAK